MASNGHGSTQSLEMGTFQRNTTVSLKKSFYFETVKLPLCACQPSSLPTHSRQDTLSSFRQTQLSPSPGSFSVPFRPPTPLLDHSPYLLEDTECPDHLTTTPYSLPISKTPVHCATQLPTMQKIATHSSTLED